MRRKKLVFIKVMCLVFAASFVQGQDFQVQSEKAQDQDFENYKTFAFASMIDNELDVGVYFLNDLVFKSQLREAIKEELMGLGYTFQKENPDLIVNFRVFQEPTTLKGFEGYGDSYWGDGRFMGLSDIKEYEVKAGTLLISFVDRKNSQVIWQGFASGFIKNDQFMKDKASIRVAVNRLMDEYGVRASASAR